MPYVVEKLKDVVSDVRKAAMEAIVQLVEAAADQLTHALPYVIDALNDEVNDVRKAAIEAMMKLVAATPC